MSRRNGRGRKRWRTNELKKRKGKRKRKERNYKKNRERESFSFLVFIFLVFSISCKFLFSLFSLFLLFFFFSLFSFASLWRNASPSDVLMNGRTWKYFLSDLHFYGEWLILEVAYLTLSAFAIPRIILEYSYWHIRFLMLPQTKIWRMFWNFTIG